MPPLRIIYDKYIAIECISILPEANLQSKRRGRKRYRRGVNGAGATIRGLQFLDLSALSEKTGAIGIRWKYARVLARESPGPFGIIKY
jgi:hypothetical protein